MLLRQPEIVESIPSARLWAQRFAEEDIDCFCRDLHIDRGALFLVCFTHPDGLEWSIEKVYGKPEL